MSKALVFAAYGGPETQELVERPAPAPGPGELAIEPVLVHSCRSTHPGTDLPGVIAALSDRSGH